MNTEVLPSNMRAVVGNEMYLVSSDGCVFSRQEWRGSKYRELRQETNPQGYKLVTLSKPRKRFFVHVLVLEAFVSARPEGLFTRHLDGDPENNHVSNLAWGSRLDNANDSKRHGTFPVGSRNGNSILTEDQVQEIRILIKQGYKHPEIADMYDVSRSCISSVATRSWQHV